MISPEIHSVLSLTKRLVTRIRTNARVPALLYLFSPLELYAYKLLQYSSFHDLDLLDHMILHAQEVIDIATCDTNEPWSSPTINT
jgi:hypothetical protein